VRVGDVAEPFGDNGGAHVHVVSGDADDVIAVRRDVVIIYG
jgi:hypothetical protein